MRLAEFRGEHRFLVPDSDHEPRDEGGHFAFRLSLGTQRLSTAPLDPMGGSGAPPVTGAPPSGPRHPDFLARHRRREELWAI